MAIFLVDICFFPYLVSLVLVSFMKTFFLFLQESELQLRRQGSCVVLVDLELPHLVRLEEDPLRTEIMLYRVMVSISLSPLLKSSLLN